MSTNAEDWIEVTETDDGRFVPVLVTVTAEPYKSSFLDNREFVPPPLQQQADYLLGYRDEASSCLARIGCEFVSLIDPFVIGFCGYAGVGKDAAAAILVENRDFTRVAFADPLREALLALDPLVNGPGSLNVCCRLSNYIESIGWDKAKENTEVRRLLQRLGTEVVRDIMGQDVFVDLARRRIEGSQRAVVTDVRFANEAAMIHDMGGIVIRIDRHGVGPKNEHVSEKFEFSHDATIENDGSLFRFGSRVLKLADEWLAQKVT